MVAPRARVTKRRFMAFVVEQHGKVLVRQRPPGVVNSHLWEFPSLEVRFSAEAPDKVARTLFGVPMRVAARLGTIKHSITRYRMTLEGYRVHPVRRLPAKTGTWVHHLKLKRLAFPSAHKKLLESWMAAEATRL